jgi:hypothetical protein
VRVDLFRGVPAGEAGGGEQAAAPSIPTVCAWRSGGSIDEFLITHRVSDNAAYPVYVGASSELGSPDYPILTVAEDADDQTVRWIIAYVGSGLAGTLTLRKRTAAGVWSTIGTQALATGDRRYTGSVTLSAGESLGAHVAFDGGGTGGFGGAFFFGAG